MSDVSTSEAGRLGGAAANPSGSSASLYLLCALLAGLCLLTCLGVDGYGRHSRRIGPSSRIGFEPVPAVVVATPQDAYRHWIASGLHGRTLVYLCDGWDRLNPDEFSRRYPRLSYPLAPYRIPDRIETHSLEARTFLYLATLKGVVRQVVAVVSPDSFAQARQHAMGAKNARVTDDTVYQTFQGLPRCFARLDAVAAEPEPVLLYVAASVFRSYSPARILEALRRKGISTDDAVLCALSEDRGVSDRERLALDEFARLLARGGA